MPHIPGHRGSNAFTGFENIRQRMEGLTPPAPFIAQAPVQSIIERIQQSPEYLQNLYSGPNWTPLTPSFVPNTFVPGGRSGTVPPRFGGRSMRQNLAGLGAPLDISRPPTVAPVAPEVPVPFIPSPQIPPLVPMPRPGWPGTGGFLPRLPSPSRFPFGGSDLLYRWPAPGTPPIRPETLPYYPSAPPPRRVLY